MKEIYPKITKKSNKRISKYVSLCEIKVNEGKNKPEQIYHSLSQSEYIGILALTTEMRIPIVRQFRPAVGEYTWELPAGTIDKREEPLIAAKRELSEECGLKSNKWISLGSYWPDTGRLSFRSHAFIALDCTPIKIIEAELEMKVVSPLELKEMIDNGNFSHQLHMGILGAAMVKGFKIFNS